MRYLIIFHGPESDAVPSEQEQAEMGEFMADIGGKGYLLAADGLPSSANGAKVRLANGQFTVIDGPFSESKEVIGGFAIVDVPSKEIALDITRRFLELGGDAECEVRLMHEVPAYPPA